MKYVSELARLAAVLNEWQSDPDEPVIGSHWDLAQEWDRAQIERLRDLLAAGVTVPDAQLADASHAWPNCILCGVAVDDPEAAEPCEYAAPLAETAGADAGEPG